MLDLDPRHSSATRATVPFAGRIVLDFDFDETLAPSTHPKVLDHCGCEPDRLVEERVLPLARDHIRVTPLALRQRDGHGAWLHRDERFGDRRVENVAPTDSSEGGEALESILLAIDSIASRIARRPLSTRR